MERAHRMADEEEFHFAAAVDKQGFGIVVQELKGFFWRQMFHDGLLLAC
jgi:hypothetical protein